MNTKWFYFSPVLLLLCGVAKACEPDSVARNYLSAIDDMNWGAMRSYLAEDAVYTDPTMIHFDQEAIDLAGADKIVEFWRSSSEESGTISIQYTITSCIQTAGYHAVNLDINVRVAGVYWNVAKDVIDIPGRVVSIIRVAEDRVTEHYDFVEYAAADAVVAKLREEYGEPEAEREDKSAPELGSATDGRTGP